MSFVMREMEPFACITTNFYATTEEWVLQRQRYCDPNMTILIYDYQELEERTSSRLKTWKAWHTTLFILTAIFGIANYTFLQNAMELVDGNCILYPRLLAFHWISYPIPYKTAQEPDVRNNAINDSKNNHKKRSINEPKESTLASNATDENVETNVTLPSENATEAPKKVTKYEVPIIIMPSVNSTTTEEYNGTILTVNMTRRLALDTSRTLFSKGGDCQFAEYMPLLSTIMATLWAVLFIMCPAGGHARSGLTQPWRILAPALFFALIFVGLTGHSFVRTNGGLQDFCAAFHNITNSTTCSSVNPMLERGWNASWEFGGRVAAARATAAGVWALWACAAAVLLARCLAAPDFAVRSTGVYLVKDPQLKVTPHLRRSSPRRSTRSAQSTPTKGDTSNRSEPTATTDLVTASVEHDSAPTSLTVSPMHMRMEHGEAIELAYSPKELKRKE